MFRYIFCFILFFFCKASFADNSLLTLKQQLDRLQREVSDLSQSFFVDSNNTKNDGKKIDDLSSLTTFDLRIYDLEKDIKKLNSNFEEIIFQLDDLKNLYENLNITLNSMTLNRQDDINNENIKINNEDQANDVLGTMTINSEDLSNKSQEISGEEIDQETEDEIKLEKVKSLSPEEEFQLAFDLLRGQQFTEAIQALKKFIKDNEENNLAGSAHYWLGEIYLLNKEFREAALILAEGYQKFPNSVKAPDTLYKLSKSLISINES